MSSSPHLTVLRVCAALFVGRVLAQCLQWLFPLEFLPPFEAWYSGALAYPWLLVSQVAIMVILAWAIWCIRCHRWKPQKKWGAVWLILGLLYWVVMMVRLVLSFTWAESGSWWHAPIPSFFHLVLAVFVMTVGHYHWTRSGSGRMQ
jgi:hypothetical protein